MHFCHDDGTGILESLQDRPCYSNTGTRGPAATYDRSIIPWVGLEAVA